MEEEEEGKKEEEGFLLDGVVVLLLLLSGLGAAGRAQDSGETAARERLSLHCSKRTRQAEGSKS